MNTRLAPFQLEAYRRAARERDRGRDERRQLRLVRAWEVARRGAALLKSDFGVQQVAVFGSLVHEALFHSRSDVDLAVWGLDERQYFRAVSSLLSLDPEIEVDLIRVEDAQPRLTTIIAQEAVTL